MPRPTPFALGWTPPPEGYHQGRITAPAARDPWMPSRVRIAPALLPAVMDQGPVGSCVGHAVATAMSTRLRAQGLGQWVPAPLDLYLGARRREGTAARDAGCLVADALTHARAEGVASVNLWGAVGWEGPPSPSFDRERGLTRLVNHEPLDWHLDTLRWELAVGFPIVVGIRVYQGLFGVGADGEIPLPEGNPSGGHAMCLVGYDDGRAAFRVRNSWGPGWGDGGDAWLPYDYATNPFWCGELHVVRAVRTATAIPTDEAA